MELSTSESNSGAERAERSAPAVVQETGPAGERRVAFDDALCIGRDEGDIRIPSDPYLSHLHVRIERAGDRFVVRDCSSTNGTFVQIRQPIELRPGDEILIGSQLFRVVL